MPMQQHTPIVRLIASPPLSSSVVESFSRRFVAAQQLLACANDQDVNATFLSLQVGDTDVPAAVHDIAETIGPDQTAGRAFRLELAHPQAAAIFPDGVVRAIGVDLHGTWCCPVYLARRTTKLSQWARARPFGWGPQGLMLGDAAPSLPYGGSPSAGVAIEAGAPTIIAKARLVGDLDMAQLSRIANAVAGIESGFADVAAAPFIVRKAAVLLIELGDSRRVPLHRVLTVIDIEGRRYGARLGIGALLSEAPLETFTDALQAHMGLSVAPRQVIETHLSSAAQV